MSKSRSIETSEELQSAMSGDRTDALQFIRDFAFGRRDFETMYFMEVIAGRILIADRTTGRRRADKLMRALSLSGRIDTHRDMRHQAEIFQAFQNRPVVDKQLLGRIQSSIDSGALHPVGDLRKTLQNELAKARRPKKSK
jgi:hypothetical protein